MAYAVESVDWFLADRQFKIGELSGGPSKSDALRAHKRDAR
jgi:hypothetical protein